MGKLALRPLRRHRRRPRYHRPRSSRPGWVTDVIASREAPAHKPTRRRPRQALQRKPRIRLPATWKGGHESGTNHTLGTRLGRFSSMPSLMVYWEASGVTRGTLRKVMGDGRQAEPGMPRLLVY